MEWLEKNWIIIVSISYKIYFIIAYAVHGFGTLVAKKLFDFS